MDFKILVSKEQATSEVDNYIASRVIKPSRREKLSDAKDVFIEAIMYGWLVINDDKTITQNLIHPVGDFNTFTYKFRVQADVIEAEKQRLKASTGSDIILINWCAYTGDVPNVYRKLEPADRETAEALTLFFV
jgi:hypothetical protein